jgi:hypothetical protein
MAATAFNRCFAPFLIHPFMTILAELMCCLLKTINSGVTYLSGMATCAFVNHHYLFLGMMAGSTSE